MTDTAVPIAVDVVGEPAPELELETTPPPALAGPSPIISPLALDLVERSQQLTRDLSCGPTTLPIPPVLTAYATSSTPLPAASDLLNTLSRQCTREDVAEIVMRRFAPLALDVLARWLDWLPLDMDEWESRLAVLASVAEPRPDLWSVIVAFLESSPFQSSPLALIPPEQLDSAPTDRVHRVLVAYWRLLVADPGLPHRWDWPNAPLHSLRTSHPDAGVRLMAVQILAIQRGWSELERTAMERKCVGDLAQVDAQVIVGYTLGDATGRSPVVVDGWMLPVIEARRVRAFQSDHVKADETAAAVVTLTREHLSRRTAVIGERLFLRSSFPSTCTLIHVPTAAMTAAISTLAPLLERGLPILISAPPSAGKTHIVQHISSQLYPSSQPTTARILTIPLADTTIDVKSLIGTYVSSPTKPGTFEWMEGALAKAVRAGRWVVFEDIDKASLEMLVTISGLAKSLRPGRVGRRAALAVPGRDEIEAGDSFAMFATRTVRSDAPTPATFFGHQDFFPVDLGSPSDSDILGILAAQFQRLPHPVTCTLVEVWRDLRPLAKTSGQVKARDIGLRDLEKWCARVERALPPVAALVALEQSGAPGGGAFANPAFQDEVFLEAVDIFVASLDNRAGSSEKRAGMIAVVAAGIGMDGDRAWSLIDSRRPRLEAPRGAAQIHMGRYTLDATVSRRRGVVVDADADARPYALTRPSLIVLERIAAAVTLAEPALLVGETGTGKTTSVQHLANLVGKPLTALNLSTQTETSDLVGGFKPIDASVAARSLHARWQKLFSETFSIAKSQNGAYLEAAAKALGAKKWSRCADLWATSARRAVDKLAKTTDGVDTPPSSSEQQQQQQQQQSAGGPGSPRKRRKIVNKAARAAVLWQALLVDIADFDLHHVKMKSKLVFSFVEGPLVKALKNGEWILLDEVNLASQETLEAVATILEASTASLVLTERGDVEPVPRHPDFRLFACMNPATDVGKKDLPAGLRARFTELYVAPPDDDREALVAIVEQYLGDAAAGDRGVVLDVVELYSTLKRLSSAKEIVDGSNAAPHYSMRTLARALMFAVQTAPTFGLRRGLWEGSLMAFTMSLDAASAKRAHEVCEKYILVPMKNARAVLAQVPTLPSHLDADDYIRFGPFWLQRGPMPAGPESRYIITPSVQAKLSDLARVILTKRYPVLIQGPTSAGKTSAVEFLARQTGHRFVRINNHEHTDIQEYLGTYVTDPHSGNLVFQEGLLVTAVRQGHWIVLDELNLAPTDVLEALNRLLDDNRELVIPETQEVIKPHPNFILFATQNPPGLYAGRKVLSRAFRNRFLEVHFDDVPKDELETILCQRCEIAPSYARKIVQVFEELRHRRQASRVFESKQSFATLRDLFRWAERGAVGYQQLADDGYMLLAERARQDDDKAVIKQVIEQVMKVSIDADNMYRLFDSTSGSSAADNGGGVFARLPFKSVPSSGLVWTRAMQRLFALVAAAAAHDEPVLLVGETGCGKTSVCEILAAAFNQRLVGVNCHQNMETADLLGSQRPVRNRNERRAKVVASLGQITEVDPAASDDELLAACAELLKRPDVDRTAALACQRELKALSALFEWSDGPLIGAMTAGDLLLLDEVSLADDSVLERLNSVLEPGRTLVLAEKGGVDIDEATIVAHAGFHVVATMNPGGDFGKKELSPALRNRFTEIWVPSLSDRDDMLQIIGQSWLHEALRPAGPLILDFMAWFTQRVGGDSSALGLRDILAWVNFSNQMYAKGTLDVSLSFHHGGQMVIVDGLESLPQVAGSSTTSVAALRSECLEQLHSMAASLLLGRQDNNNSSEAAARAALTTPAVVHLSPESMTIAGFGVKRGPVISEATTFRFEAPTTALNAMRVLRGCQLPKAILLEGSPGVGKTSLVSALSAVAGYHLQRINLSDQTDLIDLFGSDLPVEGGQAGEFQWRDAAFLDAMQKGDWVLLDEMNLASQTVLEGLNAVLDHRGTVYIPELGRSFDRHPDFRVFAAQNPLQQGGGRKGLPKSFLNRFTKVYLQEHTPEDLLLICRDLHPMSIDTVQQMITFNEVIREQTMVTRTIGREGSPWEFNLRDLFRWFNLLSKRNGLETSSHPVEHVRTVYLDRFRNVADRDAVSAIFERVFGVKPDCTRPTPFVTPSWLQIGHAAVRRAASATVDLQVAHHQLAVAESILKTIEMGWLVILAGDNGRGKRDLVRAIASAAGRTLGEFAMHPGVDTSEILGTFEQQDLFRVLDGTLDTLLTLLEHVAESHPEVAGWIATLKSNRTRCDDPRQLDDALDQFTSTARAVLLSLDTAQDDVVDTAKAKRAVDSLARAGLNSNATGFAWVDGQLLDAIRTGGWYLVSDANLCSASVLDRLNSLCEVDGVLVMSEKGSASGVPEVIKPHPDFRLFMTYDPKHGELSRAMRNRGVELYIDPAPGTGTGTGADAAAAAALLVDAQAPPRSSAMAESSLLRSIEKLHVSYASDVQRISPVGAANLVALQSQAALALLSRFSRVSNDDSFIEHAVSFLRHPSMAAVLSAQTERISATRHIAMDLCAELPLDPSLDPNVAGHDLVPIFRALQLVLRTLAGRQVTDEWVADAEHAKSVLASSALAAKRGTSRRKPGVGDGVYPFIESVRNVLPEIALEALVKGHEFSALDTTLMLLHLVEDHCKTETFDYSSIQLLATWLQDNLTKLGAAHSVLASVHKLAQATSITSGLGQAPIWTLLRAGRVPSAQRATLASLVQRLESVSDRALRLDTVRAIVAAAQQGLDEAVVQELTDLIDSLPKIKLLADSNDQVGDNDTTVASGTTTTRSNWSNAAVSHVIQLDLLDEMVGQQRANHSTLTLLSTSEDAKIDDLVQIQSLFTSTGGGVVFGAIASWLLNLWNKDDDKAANVPAGAATVQGPGKLFQPIKLASALRFSRASTVTMAEIPKMDQALAFVTQSTLWGAGRSDDRTVKAGNLAMCLLRTVLGAFGVSALTTDSSGKVTIQRTGAEPDGAFEYLEQAFESRLASGVASIERQCQLGAVGHVWHGLARFILDLFVTNVPIDPGVRRVLLGQVVSAQLALVHEELELVRSGETTIKGVADSARSGALERRLSELETEETELGPTIDRATNAARLGHLFHEVFGFMDDVFSEKHSASLVDALESDAPSALQREHSFQLASMSFVQRLNANYADLDDLAQPIATAILFAKFGMRCLARSLELSRSASASASASATAASVTAVVSFPSTAALATLQALPLVKSSDPTTQSVRTDMLVALAHARDTVEAEQRYRHVPKLVAGLDRLYQAWSAIRLRELEDAQAAESLYRVRKTDIQVLSDEELEAEEFARLFPTFDGDEIGIEADDDDDEAKATEQDGLIATPSAPAKFSTGQIAAFHALIVCAFGEKKPSSTSTSSSLDTTLKVAVDEVTASFKPSLYDAALDASSLAFQVSTLHRRQSDVRTGTAASNFYFSANEFEIRKAHALLARMLVRLDALIVEWPEQMVLQHIRDRVIRLLSCDARSPIAMVLAGLEQLLLHTDDWEPYAHRDNSLKSFQSEMSSMIVGWRRLELSSWVRLLDDQAEQYVAADQEFTLRLYGAVIHGAVSADNVDTYLESALPVVSTYIKTSSLGQFEYRLSVLGAFQRMAAELATSQSTGANASQALSKVAAVLHNILANAHLFSSRVRDSLHAQRAIIDRAVKDFVKLASWKDINVFALKASAVKSHRQLHRNIRKFRDVLQQPVASILGDSNAICPQESEMMTAVSVVQRTGLFDISPLDSRAVTLRAAAAPSVPTLLSRLDDTLTRYSAVHTHARETATDTEAEQLDSMAVEIIETASMLAKATPSTLTKENAKVVNNLASRKRKAYSDLLKALRASGFSQNVRADQLLRQHSVTWLAARPALLSAATLPETFDDVAVTKVEDYHHRQSVLMATLRVAFNGHNPDIASQDLQRGIGYTESLYAAALVEHDLLATQLQNLGQLNAVLRRLRHCSRAKTVSGGDGLFNALSQAEIDCCRVHETLREVEEGVRQFRQLQGVQVGTQDLAAVHDFRQEVTLLISALESTLSSSRAAGWSLFGQDESSLVTRVSDFLTRLGSASLSRAQASPELAHLFDPLCTMIKSMSAVAHLEPIATVSDDIWTNSDALVQALLVVAQTIDTTEPQKPSEDEYAHVPTAFTRQAKAVASLRVSEIIDRLGVFSTRLASEVLGKQSDVAPVALGRVLPFVETLAETYAQSVAAHLHATKAMYKLNYVVARLMLDLAQKGFCKPQEESDDSKDGDDGGAVDGTGMGAGTGDKNVSSEIKEESQVEGLQGEEEDEQEKNDKGDEDDDDDAVSMENDFDGKLEDGKEGEGEDEDEDEDDEDEEEPDDHVGDVDPLDPGAVDEKFWGDEDKEEKEEEKDGREDLMNEKTQETGQAELSAKEGENKENKSKDKDEPKDEPEAKDGADDDKQQQDNQQQQGDENEDDDDDAMDEFDEHGDDEGDDGDDEGPDQPPAQQDQVAAPEGDRLDLPDDLDLGEDDEGGGEDENEAFDDDIDMSNHGDEDDNGPPEDNGTTSDQEGDGANDQDEDGPAPTGVTEEDATELQEEALNQNLDLSASNDATAQEAAAAGRGQGAAENQKDEDENKEDGEKGDEEEKDGADEEHDPTAEADGATSSAPQGGGGDDQEESSGPTDSTGAPMGADQSQPQDRSLGDIMKEIRRRRDEILNQTERDRETPTEDNAEAPAEAPGQVEYVNDGDEDDEDGMQALGPAREEEQKLEDLHIVDEDDEADKGRKPGMEDDGDEQEDAKMNLPPPATDESESTFQREAEEAEDAQNAEKALTQADIGGNAPVNAAGDAMDVDDDEQLDTEIKPDVEGEVDADVDVDLTIAVDDEDEGEERSAEDLWRRYASLTSDLSYALCEQLRLILEPTLATRLQGDFRTGKRLNMRKIIPYIASEYTKDKIWLRRTKPSRREYQVLLSLDDSRSMAESHSVDLAYQTLALVAQALNKLEVGQVSIAKFGEGVDVLHDFGDGFADADGAKVMRAFKFNQHRTDVAALVERTLAYLAEARQKQSASSSAPDLWQLQIIISDGVCQDHHKLRTLLRRALEERVMIVFLIVDSLHHNSTQTPAPSASASTSTTPPSTRTPTGPPPSFPAQQQQQRTSILSMQTVNYTNVNGEMRIEMQRYLDTFPFEFYVVLRDVEALPGVLSDTLRQWMARVSQSQE